MDWDGNKGMSMGCICTAFLKIRPIAVSSSSDLAGRAQQGEDWATLLDAQLDRIARLIVEVGWRL
jgi:hypothetical protein